MSGTSQKVYCGGVEGNYSIHLWFEHSTTSGSGQNVYCGGVESNFSVHLWSKTLTLTLT